MHGHWYCSFCKEEVSLPPPTGRWDTKRGVMCPVCFNKSADWLNEADTAREARAGTSGADVVPEETRRTHFSKPVTPDKAHEEFEKMRKAIE